MLILRIEVKPHFSHIIAKGYKEEVKFGDTASSRYYAHKAIDDNVKLLISEHNGNNEILESMAEKVHSCISNQEEYSFYELYSDYDIIVKIEKVKRLFVGGYYDSRIFEGEHFTGKTPFDDRIDVYSFEEVLKLPFIGDIDESYKELHGGDFDDLTREEQIKFILEYTKDDELVGLLYFDTEEKALKYKNETLEELKDLEKHLKYEGKKQDECGYFHEVYTYLQDDEIMDHVIMDIDDETTVIDIDEIKHGIYFESLIFFNTDYKTKKLLEENSDEDFYELVYDASHRVSNEYISLCEIRSKCKKYEYALVDNRIIESDLLLEWDSDYYFDLFVGNGYKTFVVNDYKYIAEDCKVKYIATSKGIYNKDDEWVLCRTGHYAIYRNSDNDYFIFYNSYFQGSMPEPKDKEGIKKYTKEQVEEFFGENIFEE